MNLARAESASCVYNGDVIVTGGWVDQNGTDLIEILKMNQHPLRWTMFDGKLPPKLSAHDVTVYQDKLYIIAGDNWNENKPSDAIYELSLAPLMLSSFSQECLSQEETTEHKLLTGSYLSWEDRQPARVKMPLIDSVVVYDFIKNQINLPEPALGMSTVTWGNMIIVVGGVDKNYQALNDVIMYHIETGRSESLPSLKNKMHGASAVILHDVIVVLGGRNDEE
ncbi:actin-binding IPP-like [Paramuricea clavata]|uniref:Actin-binding IPP-like n=1 Tax=Paramuricea clavata TaxID=317549 RepID=A0A7D9L7V9_PARCT|nr:actin-binding IPP-like [Paramuricea clavata]